MHEKKIMLFVWYFPSFVLFLFYLFLCFSDFVIFLSTAPFSFAFLFSCLLILTFMFLQFNCFLLMPVVDKLPALLREDLESAFEDDLDNVFDITNLRHSLGVRKRDTEIELKRVLFLCCFSTLLFPSFSSYNNLNLGNFSLVLSNLLVGLQIQRLKEKFRQIHEQLCLHQVMSKLPPVSVSH